MAQRDQVKMMKNDPVEVPFYGEKIEIRGMTMDRFPEIFSQLGAIANGVVAQQEKVGLAEKDLDQLGAAEMVKILLPILLPMMEELKVFLAKALDISEELLEQAKVTHVMKLLAIFIEQNDLEYVSDFFGALQKAKELVSVSL